MGATNNQTDYIAAVETYFRQNPALWAQMTGLPQSLRIAILNTAANYAEEITVGTLADRIEERAALIFETYLNRMEDPLVSFPESAKARLDRVFLREKEIDLYGFAKTEISAIQPVLF